MNKHISKTYSNGFTIVELLIVIVVIGILAAVTVVSLTGISQKAVASSLKSDLSSASTQLKMFQVEKGNFPDTISTNCSTNPDTNTNKCLKVSPGNSYGSSYSAVNNTNPQTFTLTATNGTVAYRVTNDTPPVLVSATTPITNIASITGTPQTGSTLTAGSLTPSGATGSASYQWQTSTTSNGTYTDIAGATLITYMPVSNDVGKYLKVTATGTGSYSGIVTSAASAVVTAGIKSIAVLVVAGGGGGGYDVGGGGGAGGLIYVSSYVVTSQAYSVTVGAGGGGGPNDSVQGYNGSNSQFGSMLAIGGGGAGSYYGSLAGKSGGSGGGGGANENDIGYHGSGTSGQGNSGADGQYGYSGYYGLGGGGGGAGVAASGANGGNGLSYSISGTAKYYAGGGAGCDDMCDTAGTAGLGGGGAYTANGTANTGGGGGGAGSGSNVGGNGGSGIVIISYPTGSMTATGGTITASGGNTIHTFTSTGTFTFTVL